MSKKQNPADKVEQWPIEKLVPYAKNARTHSEEQVAQIAAVLGVDQSAVERIRVAAASAKTVLALSGEYQAVL